MSAHIDNDHVVFLGVWSGLALFWVGVVLLIAWALS